MLVSFSDLECKKALFRNVGKLRDAEESYRKVSITHDMTVKEREENKILLDQAKSKIDKTGRFKYVVKGPPWARKIHKVEKPHTEEVG